MNDTTPQKPKFQTLHQIIEAAARAGLDANIWDYLVGGSETETTLRRNRHALDLLALRPRVLRNVRDVDPSADFFGKKVRLPLILSPVGSHASFHPEGSRAVARASARFGIPIFVSVALEGVLEAAAAAAGTGPKVMQIYPRGDTAWVDDRVKRGIDAGYEAVCLTVDDAKPGRRERDMVKNFVKPWRVNRDPGKHESAFTWDDFEQLVARHKIKFILKGISTGEDAARACETGVIAVYVSNHGGRQLDHGRGTMHALPEVVSAVDGRAKIIIDGGFCRGTDIVKAIALGADLVGMGRQYLYGLAADGSDGVHNVLEILEQEVITTLGLLGVSHLSELNPSFVCAAPAVSTPGVHAAFPLLNLPDRRDGKADVPVIG